jgi:hypothetical protein
VSGGSKWFVGVSRGCLKSDYPWVCFFSSSSLSGGEYLLLSLYAHAPLEELALGLG